MVGGGGGQWRQQNFQLFIIANLFFIEFQNRRKVTEVNLCQRDDTNGWQAKHDSYWSRRSDFTWTNHVEYMAGKINQRFGLLRRITIYYRLGRASFSVKVMSCPYSSMQI